MFTLQADFLFSLFATAVYATECIGETVSFIRVSRELDKEAYKLWIFERDKSRKTMVTHCLMQRTVSIMSPLLTHLYMASRSLFENISKGHLIDWLCPNFPNFTL